MRYRTLGRTGLEVSEIGLGGAVFAGTSHGPFNEADAIAAIRAALENGVNYIDTSRHYGPSEEIIGKALTNYTDDYIVCTKISPRRRPTAAETIAGLEESLAALRRSHVEVLLAHDIQHLGDGIDAAKTILQRGGMVDGFRQLQQEGRVRFIGVSGRLAEVTAAVQFVLSEPRVSTAVVGMKSAAEAIENLSAAEEGGLDAETVAYLKAL